MNAYGPRKVDKTDWQKYAQQYTKKYGMNAEYGWKANTKPIICPHCQHSFSPTGVGVPYLKDEFGRCQYCPPDMSAYGGLCIACLENPCECVKDTRSIAEQIVDGYASVTWEE